jgi:hypothetical protein
VPVIIGGAEVNHFPKKGAPAPIPTAMGKGGGRWTRTWRLSLIYKKYSETQFVNTRAALKLPSCPQHCMFAFGGIVLQKSFGGNQRNFLGPLMRFVRRDVRDHIAYQKNGHGASYRRYKALQLRSCPKIDFSEIFGVDRFSSFATQSP